MKRRQAIKRLGVGFGTAMAGSAWLTNCRPEDPAPEVQYDGTVAVIGAGAAGLYVADLLATKGINVVVLEASNQIGGRIRSLRNQEDVPYQSIADFPVELGAEYFHGSDSVLGKIIANLNLKTIDLSTTTDHFILGNEAKDAAGWAADADLASARNFASALPDYSGGSVSVRSAAGSVAERGQPLLNGMIGNYYGTSNDRLGIKGLADQIKLIEHDMKPLMLKSNTMQDLLISRFSEISSKVKTSSPVKSINWGTNPIALTLEDGSTVECTKVIVTVPISVINKISFTPSLPGSVTGALSRIGMDASIRVILDFKKNFWGDDAGFIFGGNVAPCYFNGGVQRSEFFRTMSITANGPAATQLSALGSDQAIVEAILEELDDIYDGQATDFIRRQLPPDDDKMIYFVKDWSKETYIGGGTSYPTVSTTEADRKALATPIDSKLFFAGEATDIKGEPGTINGALNSAERCAEDLVKSILDVS